jgi:hypothetical protein
LLRKKFATAADALASKMLAYRCTVASENWELGRVDHSLTVSRWIIAMDRRPTEVLLRYSRIS